MIGCNCLRQAIIFWHSVALHSSQCKNLRTRLTAHTYCQSSMQCLYNNGQLVNLVQRSGKRPWNVSREKGNKTASCSAMPMPLTVEIKSVTTNEQQKVFITVHKRGRPHEIVDKPVNDPIISTPDKPLNVISTGKVRVPSVSVNKVSPIAKIGNKPLAMCPLWVCVGNSVHQTMLKR